MFRSRCVHSFLRQEQERDKTNVPVNMPLHDRTFDLVLLSNWEDQIVYEPDPPTGQVLSMENNLTTPANKVLESGAWTQSIIWSPTAPFRDFTQLEFNHEDDVVPEERSGMSSAAITSLINIPDGLVQSKR